MLPLLFLPSEFNIRFMRKILLLLIIVCIAIIACKSNKENFVSKYLSTNNLPQQSFVINTKKDTTIKTQQGIVVKIDAGSIEAVSSTITLQIKEALSLEDILQAGLTTQTGKGILSSEGMFNICTKEESTIKKTLQIELPTDAIDENMQLYKGVEKDGKIVWQEPKTLQPKPIDAPDGKALFTKNCASCHAIDKKLTGPALAGVEYRWQERKNLIEYIKNTQKFMHGKSFEHKADTLDADEMRYYRDLQYSRFIYCQYGKTAMNVFEDILNDKEIDAILKYIDPKVNSQRKETKTVFDDCFYYIQHYHSLEIKRHDLLADNGKTIELKIAPSADTIPSSPKVNPTKYNAEYYKFTIEGYGWYNIDKLLDDENSKKSQLSVNIKKTETQRFEMFLVIPSLKILAEGGLLDDGKSYGFYGTDGMIYLPQGIDAYVFAIGEEKEKTFFGLERFTTSLHQTIDIKIYETSKEEILRKMKRLKLDELSFSIEKSKNFDNIKAIDKEIEDIKERISKDCKCLDELY